MKEGGDGVRLTWAQIVWAAGLLVLLGGQNWQLNSLSGQVAAMRKQLESSVYNRDMVDLMIHQLAVEQHRQDARLDKLESEAP